MTIICPTIHTAAALRSGQQLVDTIAGDLRKAYQISQRGYAYLPENIVTVLGTAPGGLQQHYTAAIRWLDYWIQTKPWIAVDIETNSLQFWECRLNSIAISGIDGSNTSVSFTLGDFHTIDYECEQALVSRIKCLLADEHVTKVFHNGPFDCSVLEMRGMPVRGGRFDTMVGHFLTQPDIPHGLDWVAQSYLECRAWKVNHQGDKLALETDPYKLLFYNAEDALYTGLSVAPLLHDLQERHVPKDVIKTHMAMADLATEMEIVGMPVDHALRRYMGMKLLKKAHKLRHSLREILNWPDFNPYSPVHKKELLYGPKYAGAPWNLGIRPTKLTEKTEEPSTSYKAIIDYYEHPIVFKLVGCIEAFDLYARQYRGNVDDEVSKLKELGLDKEAAEWKKKPRKPSEYEVAIGPDGRLRPKIRPIQKGGRFSTSPNVQNQAYEDRLFFRAGPGRVIIGADKDQLELRIMCCLAGVEPLLPMMQDADGDPHTYSCEQVYGEEFTNKDEVQRKLIRNMFKNVVYASIYLAKPETVHRSIREKKQLDAKMRASLTIGFVKRAVTGYFARFPEIPEFHHANMKKIDVDGFIEAINGWRRYFPLNPAPLNEVANWPIQYGGAYTVGEEMVRVQEILKEEFKGTAYTILHGHDATYIECNERDAERVAQIVNDVFGCTRLEGPKGHVNLTAKAEIGKDLLQVSNIIKWKQVLKEDPCLCR